MENFTPSGRNSKYRKDQQNSYRGVERMPLSNNVNCKFSLEPISNS